MRPRTIRPIVCATATALALFTATAQAQDRSDRQAARAFERLDLNDNGSLSFEEYRAGSKRELRDEAKPHFNRMDKNNDAKVTEEELNGGWARAREILRQGVFAADSDKLTVAERQENAFAALDTNHDDALNAEEFKAGAERNAGNTQDVFLRSDSNKDGKLSSPEFVGGWGRIQDVLRKDLGQAQPAKKEDASAKKAEGSPKEPAEPAASSDAPSSGATASDDDDDDNESEARGKGPKDARGPDAENIFNDLDADDNDGLTLAEFQSGVPREDADEAGKHFQKMDRNGDGSVQRNEFQSGWVYGKQKSNKAGKGNGKGQGKGKGKKD